MKITNTILKYKYIVVLILTINLAYCQEKLINKVQDSIVFDSLIHKRIYKIDLANSELSLELIETLKDEYYGYFYITLNKETNSSFELFVGKIQVKNIDVEYLMDKFRKKGIENIIDCKQNNDCIRFLDADDTTFKIYSKHNIKKFYSFEELTPYEKVQNIPKNRKQALKILKLLNNKFNLKKKYSELYKKLPKGTYSFFSGNSFGRFTIN